MMSCDTKMHVPYALGIKVGSELGHALVNVENRPLKLGCDEDGMLYIMSEKKPTKAEISHALSYISGFVDCFNST